MRAVVVEASAERRLAVRDVPEPSPRDGELLVAVRAVSLNRGEVNESLNEAPDGHRPGHDFAGIVEAAPQSSGFVRGDRVFGLLTSGAWAERVCALPFLMARIPKEVSFEQAASLPVAGLTALIALSKKSPIDGRRVLVTGASGGVGVLAVQLACLAGAQVTALARNSDHRHLLTRLGAEGVAIGVQEAAAVAPYDLILDSVGGELLGQALGWLASRGVCVLFGNTGGAATTFDSSRFRHGPGGAFGGTTLYGLFLGEELAHAQPAQLLATLAGHVAQGELDPVIGVTSPWTRVQAIAEDLLARRFVGKAVLTLD
jgi:NADPH:quinone reductase-like Zn-dependent oxidoreductase